jgi:AcrR family transcriptional regulator
MFGDSNDDRASESAVERGWVRPDRRAARREAAKTEILDAAWVLVREHGLAALSLRDLAARVGMRAPSLYQYFLSKHAIYDAMFAQGMRAALDAFAPCVTDPDPRVALINGTRALVDFATSDPARAQLLFQRTIPGFEPSPESYAVAIELDRVASAALRDHGIVDPDALDLLTAVVAGVINQQLSNDPGGDRYSRLLDRVVDMYLTQVASKRRSVSKKGTK